MVTVGKYIEQENRTLATLDPMWNLLNANADAFVTSVLAAVAYDLYRKFGQKDPPKHSESPGSKLLPEMDIEEFQRMLQQGAALRNIANEVKSQLERAFRPTPGFNGNREQVEECVVSIFGTFMDCPNDGAWLTFEEFKSVVSHHFDDDYAENYTEKTLKSIVMALYTPTLIALFDTHNLAGVRQIIVFELHRVTLGPGLGMTELRMSAQKNPLEEMPEETHKEL
jgi:hypothetical protein